MYPIEYSKLDTHNFIKLIYNHSNINFGTMWIHTHRLIPHNLSVSYTRQYKQLRYQVIQS